MNGKDGKGGKSLPRASERGDGKVTRIWRAWRAVVARVLFCLPVLPTLPVLPALSQTDPRLIDAIRHAQEGRSDSARMKVRRLLAVTPANDTLYPQIVYTQAMVASEANEMRRHLQRVAVEYSSSSWADDALLRLVQLDYASGNLEGSARNLERIRSDYPGSPLLPQASYWAARTYFDQKSPELACRWLGEGLTASRGNVELQNQLGYLDQRCVGVRANLAARTPVDSPIVSAGIDTSTPAANMPEPAQPPSTRAPPPSPGPPPAAVTPAPPAAAPPPVAPTPTPAARPDSIRAGAPATPGRFRIQVSAVRSVATAEATAGKLRARGIPVVVVEEGGLYKVRVGNYATRPEAVADFPNIKAQLGGSPFVVAEP